MQHYRASNTVTKKRNTARLMHVLQIMSASNIEKDSMNKGRWSPTYLCLLNDSLWVCGQHLHGFGCHTAAPESACQIPPLQLYIRHALCNRET